MPCGRFCTCMLSKNSQHECMVQLIFFISPSTAVPSPKIIIKNTTNLSGLRIFSCIPGLHHWCEFLHGHPACHNQYLVKIGINLKIELFSFISKSSVSNENKQAKKQCLIRLKHKLEEACRWIGMASDNPVCNRKTNICHIFLGGGFATFLDLICGLWFLIEKWLWEIVAWYCSAGLHSVEEDEKSVIHLGVIDCLASWFWCWQFA